MTHIIDPNIVFTMLSALLSYCTMLLVLCHTTLLVPILYLPCCQLCYYHVVGSMLYHVVGLYCYYLYHVVGFTIYCCHVAGAILLLLSLMLNFYFLESRWNNKIVDLFWLFLFKISDWLRIYFRESRIRIDQKWTGLICSESLSIVTLSMVTSCM